MRCLEKADSSNNGDVNIAQLLEGNSDMLRVYLTRAREAIRNRKFFNAKMKRRPETNARSSISYGRLSEAIGGPKIGNGQEENDESPEEIFSDSVFRLGLAQINPDRDHEHRQFDRNHQPAMIP